MYQKTFSKKQIMKNIYFFDYDSPINIISISSRTYIHDNLFSSFLLLKNNPTSFLVQSLLKKKTIITLGITSGEVDYLTEENENETLIKKNIVAELNLRERKKQNPRLKKMIRIFNAFTDNEKNINLDLSFRIQTLKTILLDVLSIPADRINYQIYVYILTYFEIFTLKISHLQMCRIFIVIVVIYEKKIKISNLIKFTETDVLNLQPNKFSLVEDEILFNYFKEYVTYFFSQKKYLGQSLRKSVQSNNSNEIKFMTNRNFFRLIDNYLGSCTIPLKVQNKLCYRAFYI